MLRDRYESDANFWAVIEKLAIEMEPELAAIDKILDDDELYKRMRDDFGKRYPKTRETGRYSSPVEVLLRQLTVKRLYSWTYPCDRMARQRQPGDALVLSHLLGGGTGLLNGR